MATKLIIDTHGGIGGEYDFLIYLNPGKRFTLEYGEAVEYMAIQYTGHPKRQCYKCAFCHSIDLCVHFRCRDREGNMIKFKKTDKTSI